MDKLPPISAWHAEQLRVTIFTMPDVEIKPDGWWASVGGGEPESSSTQQRGAMRQWQGPVGGGQLVLAIAPSRVDWLMIPKELPEVPVILGELGPIPEVLRPFLTSLTEWMQTSPTARRVAAGVVLRQKVDGRLDGYKLLSGYMHYVRVDPEGSEDFLFQINRPRKSRDGKINRLSIWSVAARKSVVLSGPAVALQMAKTTESFDHALRLELDISTDESMSDKPLDDPDRIIHGLFDEAMEIAEKGDIA